MVGTKKQPNINPWRRKKKWNAKERLPLKTTCGTARPITPDKPYCIQYSQHNIHTCVLVKIRLQPIPRWNLAKLNRPRRDIPQAINIPGHNRQDRELFRAGTFAHLEDLEGGIVEAISAFFKALDELGDDGWEGLALVVHDGDGVVDAACCLCAKDLEMMEENRQIRGIEERHASSFLTERMSFPLSEDKRYQAPQSQCAHVCGKDTGGGRANMMMM
jgi:hypothetical protein